MDDRIRQVADELVLLEDEDQRMRRDSHRTGSWDPEVDRRSTERLKAIVAEFGWPRRSIFGDRAAHAAWLLAQHTTDDGFQRSCLERMQALPSEEINARNVAYLEDRVRMHSGRPQLYGTQFTWKDDELVPYPIEDEGHLDERRRSVGLGPFAEHRRQIRANAPPQRLRGPVRTDPV